MAFTNVLIVYSEKLSKKHLEVLDRLEKIVKEVASLEKVHVADITAELFKGKDLVIAVGGDGTFIRTSLFMEDIPILGVNSEPEFSEGFFLKVREEETERISEILKGNYEIKELPRIEVKLNGEVLAKKALNEVFIGTEKRFVVSKYKISLKNHSEEQKSSGVLVSTSCGASAWFKSAGGKSVKSKEHLAFIVREPYFGNIYSPKMLSGDLEFGEVLSFESRNYQDGIIALDCTEIIPFKIGDKVEVYLSNSKLKMIL